MNEFLADMYGTREALGVSQDNSDVEKLAEAQLLDEALRAENIDIDKLSREQIIKIASEFLGPDSALVKSAEESKAHEDAETPEEEKKEHEAGGEEAMKAAALAELKDKEAAAAATPSNPSEETFEDKVKQADFLGRVMAHSYWNEKVAIEKTAGRKLESTVGGAQVGSWKGMAAGGLGGAALGAGIGALKGGKKGALKGAIHGGLGGSYVGSAAGGIHGGIKGYQRAKAEETKHPDLKEDKPKHKKASAIDVLAEKRAMDWAQAHGLVQQPAQPTEPSDEEKLAAAVDARAVEMLTEAGVDVAAVEAATRQ